jgi:hypothetical protein
MSHVGVLLQRVSVFGFGPELHVSVQRATQSSGTLDYPRLGTQEAWGISPLSRRIECIGVCGDPVWPHGDWAMQNTAEHLRRPPGSLQRLRSPSSASFPNFTNPPATLHEHMVQPAPCTPHLQFFPSSHTSPLHSGVLQTRWELMEGPKWSPPHGAKGPTSGQANGGSSISCLRQNLQIGRFGPERCILLLPCRDPASIRWALASEGCTHHQTGSQPQRNLPYCYHTGINEQMICKGLPSSQTGALPNADPIPAAIKNP